MKKKIVIRSIIIFLLIVEGISLYILYRPNDNKEILENIKVNNSFKNKKDMISIQIQNDNDYDYHEAEDRTKWPDKSVYTYAGSTCINKDGSEINAEGIITFDEVEYTAEIQTKQTVYCTLYFTKGKPALEVLKNKGGSKFNSISAVFGLYRFKGTQTDVTSHNLNNFICFGTTDLSTCTGANKQYHMYRIIGITDGSSTNTNLDLEENQLKIIRAYPSKTNQQWNNDAENDIKWDDTTIVTYLNDTFLTVDKSKWKNAYWEGIINSPYWYIGDNQAATATTETTTKSTDKHKVGLMYKSDFVNAGPVSTGWSSGGVGETNWLYIANGMKGNPTEEAEWTMTRVGRCGSWICPWSIIFNGQPEYSGAGYFTSDNTEIVRPVFYLNSNVKLIGDGEGTETNPFIITSKN